METFRYILFSFVSSAEHDGVKDANFSRDQLMYVVCYSWRNLVMCLSPFKVQSMISDGKQPFVPCELVAVDLLFCFTAACVFLLNIFLIPLFASLLSQEKKPKRTNKVYSYLYCVGLPIFKLYGAQPCSKPCNTFIPLCIRDGQN